MRRLMLPGFVILLVAISGTSQASADPPACDSSQILISGCPSVDGDLDDDSAVLTGTQNGDGSGTSTGTGSSGGTGSTEVPPDPACAALTASRECNRGDRGGDDTATPAPTLTDIAAFRPTAGVDHMQPNGWFVVGLDANFYATGGSSVVSGTLLGYPADVRFTPIQWQWVYGDGTGATRSTPGATWAAQGIAEFDPTPTSHIYTEPGTYYIDLTIGYRAEYRFNGSGWATIAGTLWLPANRLVATVGSAKTVLVERDCTLSPVGPGCSN